MMNEKHENWKIGKLENWKFGKLENIGANVVSEMAWLVRRIIRTFSQPIADRGAVLLFRGELNVGEVVGVRSGGHRGCCCRHSTLPANGH